MKCLFFLKFRTRKVQLKPTTKQQLESLRNEQVEQSQKAAISRLRMEKVELMKTLKQAGGRTVDPQQIQHKTSPTRADLQQLMQAGEELSRANRDAEKKLAPQPPLCVTLQQPVSRTSVPLTFKCASPSTQAVLSDRSPSTVIRNTSPGSDRTPSPRKHEVRFITQNRPIIPHTHPYAPTT